MEEVKLDCWGYEVRTSSDSCISAINNYYHQVLSYGRKSLEAPIHDKDCVLENLTASIMLGALLSIRVGSAWILSSLCLLACAGRWNYLFIGFDLMGIIATSTTTIY